MQKLIRKLRLSLEGHAIWYRTDTSDREVIFEVLVREDFACIEGALREPALIVDCGAYCGYSALFFLGRFVSAHVIAIEPDSGNMEVCRRNLAPYADRVTIVQAAVWPEEATLKLRQGELADGRDWATMVSPAVSGEVPDVTGVNLGGVLQRSGFTSIDLLKMNIELSEEAVFSRNYESWLPHVKNIIIELHDLGAENAFFSAMAGYGFFLSRITGFVFCTNIRDVKHIDNASDPVPPVPNTLANGDFADLRVEPARVVPGTWIAGSTDIAASWHVVVRDPQFHVDLAVRTGLQHSGENALHVKVKPAQPVLPHSSPYAAIENRHAVPVAAGERWRLAAFIKTAEDQPPPAGSTRGAYLFLRLRYTDDSYTDLRVEPLADVTNAYVEKEAIVTIPDPPRGASIARATIWLYAWIANPHDDELLTGANWDVMFDDVSCTQVAT